MEQYNAFTVRLTGYLIENHPDMITEKDFISARGEEATATFAECSRLGLTLEECMAEADRVLYDGLLFSPLAMVRKIIDTHFPQVNEMVAYRDSLMMQMLAMVKPVLAAYHNKDNDADFEGSEAYTRAYAHVKLMINKFLHDNGIQ